MAGAAESCRFLARGAVLAGVADETRAAGVVIETADAFDLAYGRTQAVALTRTVAAARTARVAGFAVIRAVRLFAHLGEGAAEARAAVFGVGADLGKRPAR